MDTGVNLRSGGRTGHRRDTTVESCRNTSVKPVPVGTVRRTDSTDPDDVQTVYHIDTDGSTRSWSRTRRPVVGAGDSRQAATSASLINPPREFSAIWEATARRTDGSESQDVPSVTGGKALPGRTVWEDHCTLHWSLPASRSRQQPVVTLHKELILIDTPVRRPFTPGTSLR